MQWRNRVGTIIASTLINRPGFIEFLTLDKYPPSAHLNDLSWQTESRLDALPSLRALLLDEQTGGLYVGTENGLFRSTNGGASWTASGAELDGIFYTSCCCYAEA